MEATAGAHLKTMHIAWGTGAVAATKSDTALGSEQQPVRKQAIATTPSADTMQWVGTLTATGSHSITEAGLFHTSTVAGSIMLIRGVFTAIPVDSADAIEFTISMQQS
jgi:hypothetical protein